MGSIRTTLQNAGYEIEAMGNDDKPTGLKISGFASQTATHTTPLALLNGAAGELRLYGEGDSIGGIEQLVQEQALLHGGKNTTKVKGTSAPDAMQAQIKRRLLVEDIHEAATEFDLKNIKRYENFGSQKFTINTSPITSSERSEKFLALFENILEFLKEHGLTIDSSNIKIAPNVGYAEVDMKSAADADRAAQLVTALIRNKDDGFPKLGGNRATSV
ncbi:MAG: hypothetical protein SFT92_05565 [Rickettsiales bacterium]|nr:hypothetical protein [Rickettsiales bacterium]